MRSFNLSLIVASAAAVSVLPPPSYGNEYEHQHIDYGEADKFVEVPIEYEEIEYTIDHKNEPELRTRQIPLPYIHVETETKY